MTWGRLAFGDAAATSHGQPDVLRRPSESGGERARKNVAEDSARMKGPLALATSSASRTQSGVLDARPQDHLADSSAMSCAVALTPQRSRCRFPARKGKGSSVTDDLEKEMDHDCCMGKGQNGSAEI